MSPLPNASYATASPDSISARTMRSLLQNVPQSGSIRRLVDVKRMAGVRARRGSYSSGSLTQAPSETFSRIFRSPNRLQLPRTNCFGTILCYKFFQYPGANTILVMAAAAFPCTCYGRFCDRSPSRTCDQCHLFIAAASERLLPFRSGKVESAELERMCVRRFGMAIRSTDC